VNEPLANKIRPQNIEDFIGQDHLLGESGPLKTAILGKHLFSFILWGPPGSGKTTLARIYAKNMDADFFELSAVSAGKDDVRQIVATGANRKKILFLDEIHRFNKAQQDYLLPFVENGELVLIGATTENPSFEVISPLLSRCRVFVLNSHTDEEMEKIIKRANSKIKKDALNWLVKMSEGDARIALSVLDSTIGLYKEVTVENFKKAVQSKFLRYDKKGEEHYNVISAFIKSMRAGQKDSAIYYLARMIKAGEDPKFIARRMIIFASEDIGNAQPTALVVANAVFEAVSKVGLPEAGINLAHGVSYLASAKKDRSAYDALQMAYQDIEKYGTLPVPMKIRNAPTKLMEELGYGDGYEKYDKESYLPEKIKKHKYFK
jgi:putative ATPase